MKLSLCIVGCGGYAKTVLNDIHDMTDEIELYFASRDVEKAREYRDAFGGVDAFGSYEEAVSDPRVDAVYFLTPHHVHLENAKLAANHGKHILMEKPIARTLDESREVIRVARDAGVKLMVAENYRFLPSVRRAKAIIDSGDVGTLKAIYIQAEGYSVPSDWRTNAELTGGGTFIDGGIHFVNMIVNFGGFPERVYAVKPPQTFRNVEGEDGLVMTAYLPGGVVGLINFSRASVITRNVQRANISCTEGYLSFEPYGNEITIENTQVKRTVHLQDARRGVRDMVTEFRKSIEEDREPEMSGEMGLNDLAVVLGAYQSADQGGEVTLAMPSAV